MGLTYVALKVLLVVCGTWSLEFCSVIPPFCVSSSIKTVHVHVLVLEHLVVFYPLCLILITYILYKLHANNGCVAMKTISQTLCTLQEEMGFQTINAFTAFLVLDLFYKTSVHLHNSGIINCLLYYDPTLECYTQGYIFHIRNCSCCVLATFLVLPLILFTLKDCSEGAFHTVKFTGGMLCTCLLNHFRDSTRMEPMVLVTSGWFLHHSSSSEY